MQVKKFQAKDMREALAAIKEALGPDAIIVATRPLPPEGLFGKPRLEVTAALETPPARGALAEEAPRVQPPVDMTSLDSKLDPLRREMRALRGALRKNDADPGSVREQLAQMRSLLDEISRGDARGKGVPPPETWAARVLMAADVRPHLARLLARETYERLRKQNEINQPPKPREQVRVLKAVIRDVLRHDAALLTRAGHQRIALVGPTGVGKTTTIAKLAAHASMVEGRSVVLISLDTYRVGAFEQLQHYARMIKIPVYPARDKERFTTLLRQNADADLIFIDTAGRGPSDGAYVSGLSTFFAGHNVSPLLTVSAATRSNELSALLHEYRALDTVGSVFTKLDEALVLGAILNTQQICKVPMVCVTTGQRVPEDIAPAEPEAVAARIVDLAVEALDPSGSSPPPSHIAGTKHAHHV